MEEQQNFIENELIILTKATLDEFFKQGNPAELISLYTFYYYTAKWQGTNQIKATTEYASKGIKMGINTVRKVKKQLIDLGLIEDVEKKDKLGKITGHYIKINYLFKKKTEQDIITHTHENPQGGETHRVEKSEPNTLSNNNRNTLSNNIKEILSYLNAKENTSYRETTPKNIQLITARLKEKFTVDDFKKVIDKKYNDWRNTEFIKYLRPETLFGTKFESYLNEINPVIGKEAPKREYSKEKLDSLFDNINEVKINGK